MRVADLELAETPRGTRIAGSVYWDDPGRGRPDRLEFLYRDLEASAVGFPGDVLTAATFLPAMGEGAKLIVEAPVSARLLEGLTSIGATFAGWDPSLRVVPVEAAGAARSAPGGRSVASFFSGGVDGFFTLLRDREADETISSLVTVFGFDVPLARPDVFDRILPRLERVAEHFDKRLIVVETNAREIGTSRVRWAFLHGPVLAATALGLQPTIRRCYIAPSWREQWVEPWGSHPRVDGLWSTEVLELVHDSADIGRTDKIAAIQGEDLVLETLRVCLEHPEEYNCCRCDKCISTMVPLEAAGLLRSATAFAHGLPDVGRVRIGPTYMRVFAELAERVPDPVMRRSLERALQRSRWRRRMRGPLGRVARRMGLRRR